MLGALIVNGYVNSNKFLKFYDFIVESFKNENISLDVIKNTDIKVIINSDPFTKHYDFILFFDKDVVLASHLERLGYKVFNSSSSIAICDDKGLTHLVLSNNKDINMPKTLINPFSYERNFLSYEEIVKEFKVPFILKERKGSFGEQVYLVYSKEDYHRIISDSTSSILIQEYIDYHYHEDYRLYVVNNEVVLSLKRIGKDNDFRANVTLGGHMEVLEVSKEMKEMAEKISKTLNLSFGGLDFMLDEFDKPIFIEANSNAHFLNAYAVSNINIASIIARYLKKVL